MPTTARLQSAYRQPSRSPAPDWVGGVIAAFAKAASAIDSRANHGVTSDAALAALRPALAALGVEIEAGKKVSGKIRRPVLFGEAGHPRVAYEVDGFHPGHGIVLEVEAGAVPPGTRTIGFSFERA